MNENTVTNDDDDDVTHGGERVKVKRRNSPNSQDIGRAWNSRKDERLSERSVHN